LIEASYQALEDARVVISRAAGTAARQIAVRPPSTATTAPVT